MLTRTGPLVVALLLLVPACRSGGDAVEGRRNDAGHHELELEDGHVFIRVPPGEFAMGAQEGEPYEQPVHRVHLDAYWIGKFPVTVAQFRTFVEATGHVTDAERGRGSWIEDGGDIRHDASWRDAWPWAADDLPVVCVSWNDAMAFAAWMAERTGLHVTLPTEAQWERAARGTDGRLWPWGNEPPDGTRANFADARYAARFPDARPATAEVDDGYAERSPVDAYPAGRSPVGAYDMAGNTIDWLYEWFDEDAYQHGPRRNPTGPERQLVRHAYEIPGGWGSNLQRAIRGGAWTDAPGTLSLEEGGHSIRSDRRESTDQFSSDDHLGFRLAIDPNRPRVDLERERAATIEPGARAAVSEEVGGAEVRVEYRRAPVAGHDLRLFGHVVPYGEPWSIAGPTPALLTVGRGVRLEGQPLPRGTYALSIVPAPLPEGAGTWEVRLHEWDGEPGDEALRVRSRAQLEDNSKEHLEVFFDEDDDGGTIARVLWEFVEVHLAFSAGDAPEVQAASARNAVGERELAVEYARERAGEGPVFGGRVPFDEPWEPSGAAFLECRGDLDLGGARVAAGRYHLAFVPRREGPWLVRLTPVHEGGTTYPVTVLADVEWSEEHAERSELYFDHGEDGAQVLVLVWGAATAILSVAEPGRAPRTIAEEASTADELLAAFVAVEPHATRVEFNEKGCLEATFHDGTTLVYVPAGTFRMGSDALTPDEVPEHDVFLSGYWIGKYPVTNADFARFVASTGYETDCERPGAQGCYVYDFEERYFVPTPGRSWRDAFEEVLDDHPVACVSWYDGQAYCAWLSGELGIPLGLPSEAQWEKAARGTDGRIFPWGNEPPDATRANFCDRSFAERYPGALQGNPDLSVDDGYAATAPVDAFPAGQSPYGVFDLAGNHTEWVFDFYEPYPPGPRVDPLGPSVGDDRCMRCGIWVGDAGLTPASIEEKHNLRAENRSRDDPRSSDDHLGIRVAARFR